MKRIKQNLTQMHKFNTYLILFFISFLLTCLFLQTTSLTVPEVENETGITRIGAIIDQTSRPGKEAKVAIELAIQDFNLKNNQSLVLYLQNSRNKPVHAAIAGKLFSYGNIDSFKLHICNKELLVGCSE